MEARSKKLYATFFQALLLVVLALPPAEAIARTPYYCSTFMQFVKDPIREIRMMRLERGYSVSAGSDWKISYPHRRNTAPSSYLVAMERKAQRTRGNFVTRIPLDQIPPPLTEPTFDPVLPRGTLESDRGTYHIPAESLDKYRIFNSNGRWYDAENGEIADTAKGTQGIAIYMMDVHGNFYIIPGWGFGTVKHSSFNFYGPVGGAGSVRITNGQILMIDHGSGHYRPTKNQFLTGVGRRLKELGEGVDGLDDLIY